MLFQGQDASLGSLSDVDDLETTFLKVRSYDAYALVVGMIL